MSQGKKPGLEMVGISAATAIISQTLNSPLERIKLLLQNQSEIIKSGRLDRPYKGIINCIIHTYKTEGVLQFWRGNLIACIRCFPSHVITFAMNDKLKALFRGRKDDSNLTKLSKNIASGSAAGALTIVFIYSLDYTRIRLANDVKVTAGGAERQFRGIIDVYRQTLKSDGVRGLYRGFVVSCLGIAVYRGFYFGLYDTLKPLVLGEKSSLSALVGLGYTVTITAGLISYPLDTVRCRMLMRSAEPVKYRGSMDCAIQIIRGEGYLALWRGAMVNILRGVVGAGMLAGFSKFKDVYNTKPRS